MTAILTAGVDLTQFENDFHYNPNFDILFVEIGSRLYTWLSLKL